ncbi:RNA polymerase sigma factor [Anaerosolibacter carboniphilus]
MTTNGKKRLSIINQHDAIIELTTNCKESEIMEESVLSHKNYSELEYQHLLYKTYYRDVFRSVYYIVHSIDTAEELTNEAFLKAFQKMNTLNDSDKFKQWICVIATNLAKNYLKKNNRIALTEDIETVLQVSEQQFDIVSMEIEKEEERKIVRDILDKMNPEAKQIIMLRYYNDLSYQSISDELNMKMGTVKAKINRAKKQIHDLLVKEGVNHGKE